LVAALHDRVPDIHRLTRTWVEVNSYSRNVAGVNAVAGLLEDAFRLPGLEFRREKAGADCGDHLFWSTPAAEERPPILLIGHHDTVFPPGHFEGWREEGSRAYGPGSFDMKGGLALIWGVMKTLADAGLLERLSLVMASVADEEVGSLDSKRHLESLARRASLGLVFESGRPEDQIVTRRRGIGGVRAVATGKAAHAGNAHRDGANAIWALARFIELAQAQTDYAQGTTVNVGTVVGGTSPNTVPASAEAMLDLRFESVADAEALIDRLREGASTAALPGTEIRLEGGIKRLPMERTPASAALCLAYAEAQRASGLGDGEHPLVGGGSDANTVAGVGLPVIDGLGPRGGDFHTTREYVELDSFGAKAEALLRFLWGKLARTG
jgi:glutamate carboxypeptidase